MKHDHIAFAKRPAVDANAAYAGNPAEQVRRFLPMVRRLAWHAHGGSRPGIEVEDLVQVGLMALIECVQRHQGQGEYAFATYARMRVRGAMIDLIRREAPITRTAARTRREIDRMTHNLSGQLGRLPDEAELGRALGVDARELASMRATSEPTRLQSIDDCYSDSNSAFADGSADGHALMEGAEQAARLGAAIASLSERHQLIVQLYFLEEMNLSEIAAVLDVSVPRVHQLKAQALERLRSAMCDTDVP